MPLPLTIGTGRSLLSSAEEYYQRMLAIGGVNTLALWPFWEAAGATADDIGPANRDATYSGSYSVVDTFGDRRTAISLGGAGRVNVSSVAGAFNGAAGSLSMWLQVGVAEWTDATVRYAAYLYADANNQLWLRKSATANTLTFAFIAGGTARTASFVAGPSTAWLHVAITWSASGVRVYLGGDLVYTGGVAGTWAGSLATAVIGAVTTGGSSPWVGGLARVMLLDRALTASEITILARRSPEPYADRLRRVVGAGLVGHWPLWDASGAVATAINDADRNGAYNANVTLGTEGIGDGRTAASFNGTTSAVNVLSAEAVAAITPDELTVMAWLQVGGAGVWSDATTRRVIYLQAGSSANRIYIAKRSADATLEVSRSAGGAAKGVVTPAQSALGWLHIAVTVSVTANELRGYLNGEQYGSTQTPVASWAGGALDNMTIGATGYASPSVVWSGSLAHVAIINGALSAAQIAALGVL